LTQLLSRTARIAGAALLVFVFLAVQLFSYHSPTVDLLGSGEAARVAVERSGSCRNTTRSNRTANRTTIRLEKKGNPSRSGSGGGSLSVQFAYNFPGSRSASSKIEYARVA